MSDVKEVRVVHDSCVVHHRHFGGDRQRADRLTGLLEACVAVDMVNQYGSHASNLGHLAHRLHT